VRRIMYATILTFVLIMVIVLLVAIFTPVVPVKYEDGVVVEETL